MAQHSEVRGRQTLVNSRPAWSTEGVPGQAPKLQRNPVNKTKQNKQKISSFGSLKTLLKELTILTAVLMLGAQILLFLAILALDLTHGEVALSQPFLLK